MKTIEILFCRKKKLVKDCKFHKKQSPSLKMKSELIFTITALCTPHRKPKTKQKHEKDFMASYIFEFYTQWEMFRMNSRHSEI